MAQGICSKASENVKMAGFLEKKGKMRAKNRETQEEWLQALLDSMSLPLFCRNLKSSLVPDLHGHRYSMDNIHSGQQTKKIGSERSIKYRQGLDQWRKDENCSIYGGSLDTIMWSRKSTETPTSNSSKCEIINRTLELVEEVDSKYSSNSMSLIDNDDDSSSISLTKTKCTFKEGDEKIPLSEVERERCSEGIARFPQGKFVSGFERNIPWSIKFQELDEESKSEESQFERIKNAIRKTRNKAFKSAQDHGKKQGGFTKKRRESFLLKMFRRNNRAVDEQEQMGEGSEAGDPLYETIENVREQKESLILSITDVDENGILVEELSDAIAGVLDENPCDSAGGICDPRTHLLTAQAMNELKTKLRPRENDTDTLRTWHTVSTDVEIDRELETVHKVNITIPNLPLKTKSNTQPIPGACDYPNNGSNNGTSADMKEDKINIHESPVKLHKDFYQGESCLEGKRSTSKDMMLTSLLEQLTNMTFSVSQNSSAQTPLIPLPPPNLWVLRSSHNSSEPDYDVPRPHKPSNPYVSEASQHSQEFRTPCPKSDSGTPLHSMEPDSLETTEKKVRVNMPD